MSTLKYENLLQETWRNIDNKIIDIGDSLAPYEASESLIIHIGTDAQKAGNGKGTDFVTCICIHEVGKGGRVLYMRFKGVDINNLWEKLYSETMLSLQVAVELTEMHPDYRERILVHVDANPDERYASSDHVKALAGMVMGYGFKHVLKPDSWASSHAADHIVKHRNNRR